MTSCNGQKVKIGQVSDHLKSCKKLKLGGDLRQNVFVREQLKVNMKGSSSPFNFDQEV